jgi:hypothetical protein
MNSNLVSVGSSGCSRHDEAPVRTLLFVVDPRSMGASRRDPHSPFNIFGLDDVRKRPAITNQQMASAAHIAILAIRDWRRAERSSAIAS